MGVKGVPDDMRGDDGGVNLSAYGDKDTSAQFFAYSPGPSCLGPNSEALGGTVAQASPVRTVSPNGGRPSVSLLTRFPEVSTARGAPKLQYAY